MDAVPLFLTTIGLTVGVAFLLTKGNLQQIKSQWNQRRCELPVMIMAHLFKPDDDPRTPSEFSNENFSFCSRFFAKSVLQMLLAPVQTLLGKQIDVTFVMTQALNLFRFALAQAMESFNAILDPFYRRFMMIGFHFGFVFKKFMNAMERVQGTTVAAIYSGISLLRGVLNFKDFVIKVILIIMGILIAAIILLFFILLPVLPVVLTTVAVLASVGIGVAGGGAFCFSPETEVVLQSGKSVPIASLHVGDALKHGGFVEGILLTERDEQTSLYSYKGIVVSGSHLVFEEGEWKSVETSTAAIPIESTVQRLISLRTKERTMICRNDEQKEVLFRDWEEIPPGDTVTDAEWDTLVETLLSTEHHEDISEEDPLFAPTCCVKDEHHIERPLHSINIGDRIQSGGNSETRVLGIYRGLTHTESEGQWSTDGVWWKTETGTWIHKQTSTKNRTPQIGLHLVTESGTFEITTSRASGIVRDFTEVGYRNLITPKEFLLDRLNEKHTE